MARASFGGGAADFVFTPTAGGLLKLAPATLTLWTAQTGGTQITDLLVNGAPATTITVGADGQIPTFQGPDGVVSLWASAGGARVKLVDLGNLDTTDGAVTAVDGNPASQLRVQQDARLKATYAQGVGLGFSLVDPTETTANTSDPYPIGTIAGVGYGNKEAGTNPGLYKTTDGTTWTYVGPTAGYGIHPLGDGEVLLNQNSILKRSTGWATNPATATWTTVATANGTSGFIRSNVDTYSNIVIAAEYAVPRTDSRYVKVSADNGVTFTNVRDLALMYPGQKTETHWHAVAIDRYHTGPNPRLWISHGDGPRGVFYSDDLGATWTTYATDWQPMPLAATPSGIVTMTDNSDPDGVWLIPRNITTRRLLYKIERPFWQGALVGFGVAAHRDDATGVVYMLFRIDQQTYFTKPVAAMIFATNGKRADLIYSTVKTGAVGVSGTIDFVGRPTLVAGKLLTTYADTAGGRFTVAGTALRGIAATPPTTSLTSVAIGAGAVADQQSVAIGALAARSATTDAQAVIVGEEARAGDKGTALGFQADALRHGTALGFQADANGLESTALGSQSVAWLNSTAVGRLAVAGSATSGGSVAIGRTSNASGAGSAAILGTASAQAAVGILASATANYAIAIGNIAGASATYAVAVGPESAAADSFGIAIGMSASVPIGGFDGIAVGHSASAGTGQASVAIGQGANGGTFWRSVALGSTTTATDHDQVQIGSRQIEVGEMTAPANPAVNKARIYVEDNGVGKTRLVVKFPTGSAMVLATEA